MLKSFSCHDDLYRHNNKKKTISSFICDSKCLRCNRIFNNLIIFLIVIILNKSKINSLIVHDTHKSIDMNLNTIKNFEEKNQPNRKEEILWLNKNILEKENQFDTNLNDSSEYKSIAMALTLAPTNKTIEIKSNRLAFNANYDGHYLLERNRSLNNSSNNHLSDYFLNTKSKNNLTLLFPKSSNDLFYDQIPRPPHLIKANLNGKRLERKPFSSARSSTNENKSTKSLLNLPKNNYLNKQVPRLPQLEKDFVHRNNMENNQTKEDLNLLQLKNNNEVRAIKDNQPTPFHFANDDPIIEQIKKQQNISLIKNSIKQQHERQHKKKQHYNNFKNIQNILQKLRITKDKRINVLPHRLKMNTNRTMPLALQIIGSFKNLQSSGILKYLQQKRNDQRRYRTGRLPTWPIILPTLAIARSIGTRPVLNVIRSRSQNFANDQFHSFKPRSPNDINLLAIQQQQNQVHWQPTIIDDDYHQQQISQNNLKFSTNNDNYDYPNNYSGEQLNTNTNDLSNIKYQQNYTQSNLNSGMRKRPPFNMNLDMYPMIRAPEVIFNDMQTNVNNILPIAANLHHEEFLNNPLKHHVNNIPTNSNVVRHSRRYPNAQFTTNNDTQQRHHSNRQNVVPLQMLQKSYGTRNDCDRTLPSNAPFQVPSSKAIMLHLNLFPKPMKSSTAALRRQPLHNNFSKVNHHQIQPDSKFGQQFNTMLMNNIINPNQMKTQSTSEENEVHLKSTLMTNTILNNTDHLQKIKQHPQHHNTGIADRNLEMIAAEAQIASLFRFPVESLQQFQAHDAM